MSCPDWTRLVEQRDLAVEDFDAAANDPALDAAWQRAMSHLDGCSECHERAIAADPTLLFSLEPTRPSLELSSVALADEAEAMRRAVKMMRRTEHLKAAAPRSRSSSGSSVVQRVRRSARTVSKSSRRAFRALPGWPGGLRAAAIMAGILAAGGLASNSLRSPGLDFAVPPVSTASLGETQDGMAGVASAGSVEPTTASRSLDQPVFEPLEMPDANYYEVEGEHATFVMLVGESFEDIQVGPAAGS